MTAVPEEAETPPTEPWPLPAEGAELPPPDTAVVEAISALQYPAFVRVWVGAGISSTGTWMQNVAVPYVIYRETGSAALLGVTGFLQFIPVLFVGPIGGWLADRHPRRSVLLVTQSIHASLAVVLWAAYASGFRSPLLLIGIVLLSGIVQGLNVPAWQAFVPELVPRSALLSAVTMNSAQFNGARAVGPAIAGVVLGTFGASWAFLINALSYAAVILALLSVSGGRGADAAERSRMALGEQMRQCIRYVRRSRGILATIALVAASSSLGQPFFLLMPVVAQDVFHVEAWRFGLMTASFGVGSVAGAVLLGTVGAGRRRSSLVRVALSCYALSIFTFGLAPSYWIAVFAALGAGLLYLVFVAPLNTTVQLQTPDHLRGGVLALYVMTFNVAYPLGTLVQGVVADIIGPRLTISGSAALLGVALVIAGRRRAFPALDGNVPHTIDA